MSTLRIVLADDHEIMRAGLRALLERVEGIRIVGEAANGLEAVELARELRPDVVVMDLSMPVLDGVEATAQIVAECPEVRVLALSAHDDRQHVQRILSAGAAGYVVKRAAYAELVNGIRAVAAGGSHLSAGLPGAPKHFVPRPQRNGGEPTGKALSDAEAEVLRRVASGESHQRIAEALGIDIEAAEARRAQAAEKLGLRTRTQIVRYAIQQGWLAAG